MSFLTWRCDLPQKEQSSCSLESVGRAMPLPSRPPTRLVLRDHPIDDPVLLRLLRAHEVVALGVLPDLRDVAARVLRNDLIQPPAELDDLARVDLDVRRLALEAGGHLVD